MKTRRVDVVLEVACGTRGVATVAKRTQLLFRAENERALRKKHRSAFQPINIKLYEEMGKGGEFVILKGFTIYPPQT